MVTRSFYAALADYHVHTPLCRHAEGTPAELARAAAALGLAEIGFSDHSPMPQFFDDWRMLLEELPQYLEAVEEARTACPQIAIRLGLEVDYIPGMEGWLEELSQKADWDYLIGSVHYIAPGWDVDNPKHLSRYNDRPLEEIWELYFTHYIRAIRTRAFDFMAHPDLPKKFGHRPQCDMKRWFEPTVAALAETGTAFEINTAGLRKPVGECYPELRFLQMAREAGVPLLINSDAHAPGEVGAGFEEAVALAKAAGYTSLLRFEKRKRREVPLPEH